jgi:hypothetical protein
MTAHKHVKRLVRARMQKTGESYAAARRQAIRQAPSGPTARRHFPENVPATMALRMLLTHAGVRAPHTALPHSEAMLFGIAGGIGAGVFSFVYEQQDFASFFVAGRHNWQDDLGYLRDACTRLGVEPVIRERRREGRGRTSARGARCWTLRGLGRHGPPAAPGLAGAIQRRGLSCHHRLPDR